MSEHTENPEAREYSQLLNAKVVYGATKGGQPIKETRTVTRSDGSQEITVTEKVSQPEWRASAWILERRFTESWGRCDILKGELKFSGVVATKRDDAELDALIAERLERLGRPKDEADNSSEAESE